MIPNEVNIVLSDIWPMLLLFIIVLFTIRIIDVKLNNKVWILHKEINYIVFMLYMLLLFELVTSTDFESYSNNFIPFKEIMRYTYTSELFFKNVIGNVLLFIPFGYFVNNKLKNNNYKINLIFTIIISLSIEIIQMFIGRSFDIDDIILNICGGILGYSIFRIKEKIKSILPKSLNKNWIYDIIWILIVVGGLLFLLNYYGVLML